MSIIRFTTEAQTSQQAVSVWHWDTAGTATTAKANECIAAVDAFYEGIKLYMWPVTYNHGTRVVTVDGSPNVVVPATMLTTTGSGANKAPAQVAAVVSWQTQFIGKSYRGRNYIGPLAQAALNADGLSLHSSALTTFATALSNLTATTTSGCRLAVWSRKLLSGEVVTNGSVQAGLKTQRGRLT